MCSIAKEDIAELSKCYNQQYYISPHDAFEYYYSSKLSIVDINNLNISDINYNNVGHFLSIN